MTALTFKPASLLPARLFATRAASPPWDDAAPIRAELFSADRLEQHADSLATAQPVTRRPAPVVPLRVRLEDNARVILAAYRASAAIVAEGVGLVPAAEWLLDNYHLVEEQIAEIRSDLPPEYYKQLPKLAEGPFAGYPRVFGVAWAYVAHTDSHMDPNVLRRFLRAYQQVQPLEIGELWAVPITLRIVLIENLRRLADQITQGNRARGEADALADRLLLSKSRRLDPAVAPDDGPLTVAEAAQLAKRLRDQDPRTTPALGWLEDRLRQQGTTLDEVVLANQQRQGASNVTIRNVILSLKLISQVDWAELFESVSLVDARFRWASDFAEMDFATRNLYRSAIEQLARRSPLSETEVADKALEVARRAGEAARDDAATAARLGDPGYYLIASGRLGFERAIGFKPPARLRWNRWGGRLGLGGYVGAILLLTAAALAFALAVLAAQGVGHRWIAAFGLLVFLPATEMATSVVNRVLARQNGPAILPGLELLDGVPTALRTVVAVPTLLTGTADILEQVGNLEVHFLAADGGTGGGDMVFALLSDGVDAASETTEGDAALIETARAAVQRLNERHGPGPAGPRFLLLHRHRRFNPSEGVWMGWERKRGKLHELNRLLRGATDTSYMAVDGVPPAVPPGVRYVITLDADTRLPRGAALRLVGKMAHPLNRPVFRPADRVVSEGYAILQPRVTPALPLGRDGSFYQRVFSAAGGIDPYSAAVSDVYQDLLGEGSYTGKGIYEVDGFERALAGRVPDNAMLSHDLFEGVFARAGLASDVEVIEEYPTRYDVAARRQHRWTRGDWQLLPWILGRAAGGLPQSGRWKMLDNLRRSLLAPLTLLALGLAWLQPLRAGLDGVLLVLGTLVVPIFLSPVLALLPVRPGVRLRSHLRRVGGDALQGAEQLLLLVTFLPDTAWRMADAIVRTLGRLYLTREHLLEWVTAAQSSAGRRPGLGGFYRFMAGGTVLGVGLALVALVLMPHAWAVVLPFGVLWAAAPAIAQRISRPVGPDPALALLPEDAQALRRIARRTWRFFEVVVTPRDNMLPPDNLQEDPIPVLARRTSPTNIGLYLLSCAVARDLGWVGTTGAVERLEAAFASLDRMAKFNGHLLNWYATEDLRALEPPYVSTVDSGNLAGHLVALANAVEEWIEAPVSDGIRAGFEDALLEARAALRRLAGPDAGVPAGPETLHLSEVLDGIGKALGGGLSVDLGHLVQDAAAEAEALAARRDPGVAAELVFWTGALRDGFAAHVRDRDAADPAMPDRLRALAGRARALALGMDFAFLLDPERELLSIGYAVNESRLDVNRYDLLASEARLASLFAIAKGDVPTRHWFRLGRAATPLGRDSGLISWAGSMFEYLMPSLVMRAPSGSLLDTTNRLVVQRQMAYGAALGVPWGVSESAYNARDVELTYQYAVFGVPGLGLKRGLSENVVMAPYATGLATMVDPQAALTNFGRLAELGAASRYGFFEAVDFNPTRLPEGEGFAVVRTSMAHHQGMTVVAIANALQDGRMRKRFHREPMIQACELLLQERMPRDVAKTRSRSEEPAVPVRSGPAMATARQYSPAAEGAPVTHLLSNGRYSVMLTLSGGGYSRWQGMAVTRWREDATRDDWGSFVYLRDVQSGRVWSAGAHPVGAEADQEEVSFHEDHAEFLRRDGGLTTTMDVLVSSEDDGEVRRVSLANGGKARREVELTSYAELVLTTPQTDTAHPAFAKMFVQTEYLPELRALIATRRPRQPGETPIWVAHYAVVEGDVVGEPAFETDRARFVGRGQHVAAPAALAGDEPLSGSVGTVLDPVFALRYRLRIAPGGVGRVSFWTVVASSRAALLVLVDKHHDRSAFDRARTLAWTQGQVQLRHLGIDTQEAADFQRLAAPILYADPLFRAPSEAVARGMGPQSDLWALAISGDLPIVLLRIDDVEDMAVVRQMLRAYEYWRMKRLAVDLVIVNDRASSYVQDLQIAIETAVRSSQSIPVSGDAVQGKVTVLRADLVRAEQRALLRAIARVALTARGGPIAEQLARLPQGAVWPKGGARREPRTQTQRQRPVSRALEFFNGLGGFDRNGTEYVTVLEGGRTTPAPWLNVIANPGFGFQASAEGSGYTWAENSRDNQVTPWSNDSVVDPPGEAMYVRDEQTGDIWTATALPVRDVGTYVARHGHGYSRFEHRANGVALELLQYVPVDDPVKISRLTLRNMSPGRRRLSVTAFAEWVLGTNRSNSSPFVITEMDEATGAMLARNPWGTAFPGRVSFSDLRGAQTSWTGDRTEFLGRAASRGGVRSPAALLRNTPLSGRVGAGFDPCSALMAPIELGVGETVEVVWLLGQVLRVEQARELVAKYRAADLDAVLLAVTRQWADVLGAVQVRTPDRSMDVMLNGWLLYQTLACRVWARSAFYQASGAYGFRDQLQDGMALSFTRPDETRRHLLRSGGRQFVEGDVQHWWLPHSGQGVRTRISDDRVWLAYAAATYVATSGDAAVLEEQIPFLEGPALAPGEHDHFFQPMTADVSASLFEHCARGLDQCLELTGQHGLPLMGTGDWNDGMNRVGEGGQGESVWLAWLLLRTIDLFAPHAEGRDPARAARWRAHAARVRQAVEGIAWDGAWYRRATFDDGTWLGSIDSEECRIDSIAQSWSVLSGVADPAHAEAAMASLERHLVRRDVALALLFEPPFDQTRHDPGYIKGYPPGLRENGGQYTHAAMWVIYAFATMGHGDKAAALFELLNPVNHAASAEAVERYKVEPYVVAADVYSVSPHAGRGGWTWYTGSGGWMYRAGVEAILGITRAGPVLRVAPNIPAAWPGFEATVTVAGTVVSITVVQGEAAAATLDGVALAEARPAEAPLDGVAHVLHITLGPTPA